jgi:PadR family transcriptional regulator PadR
MGSATRGFFLGFIRNHILLHANGDGRSGVDMKKLSRHGYFIGPRTLYPILHRMRKEGLLSEEKRVINGRMRI